MLNKINTITLPSFLRRAMKAYALKSLIRKEGCILQRIGRSRHWQLKANFEQIQTIIHLIELANEPSWAWLIKLLQKEYQHLSHDELIAATKMLDNITVSTIIARTNCTIAQARKVIDELEGLD